MKTKTIGEMLKEERELHGITLADMAKRTRIKMEYLEALEANRFKKLPAATFVKGYIKSYAQLFGFDAQPLIAILRRDFKESARGKLVPREFVKPVLKKSHFWTPVSMAVMAIGVVFVSLLVYVGVQWYSLNKPPEITISQPDENQVVSAQVEVVGQTEPDVSVLINAKPVALQPDGSFETEVFLSREGINTITIEAKDRRGKTTIEQRSVQVEF